MKRIAWLLLALTAGTAAYAQAPVGPPPPHDRVPPIERLAKALNLSENQKTEVQRIFEQHHTQMEADRAQMKASGTRPTFEEMKAKFQQMQQETLTELSSVLTADQLAKYKAIEAEREAHRAQHRHGPPPGPPPPQN